MRTRLCFLSGKSLRKILPAVALLCTFALHANTYTVTNTNNSGSGSFRQAILDANSNAGADIIKFSIAVSGVQTISLTSSMDSITGPVTIDGTTEGGYSGTPLIFIDGTSAGVDGIAIPLTATATNSVVKGLAIGNFQEFAMYIEASGCTVTNCYIGTDAAGTTAEPNSVALFVTGASCTIGGTSASLRNLISGNSFYGIELLANAAGCTIQGNYIGVDINGTSTLANGGDGIFSICANTTVGGTAAGAGNVISGATGGEGVNFTIGADNSTIQGNLIGTDKNGTSAIGNNNTGVYIHGAKNCLVGGTTASARNIISGNKNFGGLELASGSGNTIEGNYIGTNITGTSALGNTISGITLDGATNTSILNNVISGNTGTNGYGISITAGTGNIIQGNYIGLNAAGTAAIANAQSGIRIATTSAITIGGTLASQRNIISGNTKAGITQSAGSSHTISNNYIGINAAGTAAIPNGTDGVAITGSNCTFGNAVSGGSNIISGNTGQGVNITGAGAKVYNCYIGLSPAGTTAMPNGGNGIQISNNTATIGGTSANQGNFIAGNTSNGISISGGTNAIIQGNIIGLNAAGTAIIANGSSGISISGGSGATVGGGASSAARNIISGNTSSGVSISGTATGVKIQNNYIGTNPAGTSAFANNVGVSISSSNNTVGSDIDGTNDASEGNIISGNTTHGILISGSSNNVRTNVIGLNASGTVLANGSEGIMITGTNNTVGGSTSTTGTANVISGNNDRGIYIQNSTATGNTILGNYIGTDATGATAKPNAQDGIILDAAQSNTIGGNAATSRNIISGNTTSGVLVTNSAKSNTIDGNYIGTNAGGTSALANGSVGIYITSGANTNTIGGLGNLISGNTNVGVYVNGTSSVTANVIKGNYIGVNAAGSAALTNNNFADISFLGGATGNTVGGSNTADRNIISGAGTSAGILIQSGSQTIENNYIGTDASGSSAIHNSAGITVNSTGNTIGVAGHGNVISGNTGSGIILNAGSNNIYGNYIGLNAAGTSALANGAIGISFNSSSSNNIGSSATGGGNVIAGNTGASADVEVGTGSDNNVFTANYIHINAAGTAAISNLSSNPGVLLDGATGTSLIGNVISGTLSDGIKITANSATIKGNYIGINAAGTSALANSGNGINITNTASGSTIGGTTSGDGNVISGNTTAGILLNSTGNSIQGNIIGLNASGAAGIANHTYGIDDNKGGNTIGGNTAAARNIISGNTSHGIEVTSAASTADQIQGNYIGTDITGSSAIGNGGQGIDMNSGSHNITGNVIAGNSFNGIILQSGSNSVTVKGNYVGTNASGTTALANNFYGIILGTSTSGNVIGGTSAGEGNLASGNNLGGIFATGASGGTIIGNLVGTDINGTSAIANGVGIKINASSNIVIGGSTSGDANVISGNTGDGINSNSAITVKGNFIGTDITGSSALGNGNDGILSTAGSNVIGGTTTNERNTISGNTASGIELSGSSNTIKGNYIGTNAAGTAAIANGSNGISITAGGSNTIGGTVAGSGNIISGNTGNGINLQAGSNTIQGNNIGTNAAGTSAIANGSSGINIASGTFNIIGGSAVGGNIISGNTGSGITDQSSINSIKGNYIGVNASSTAIANGADGITLSGTGSDPVGSNTISSNAGNGIKITAGSSSTISLNIIQNNTGKGITLTSGAGTGNRISQNVIGGQ
jgi:parallel beta-helix repeat protein